MVGGNGSGKSTLLRQISGLDRPSSGRIEIDGAPVAIRSPQDAIRAGLAYVTEDRKVLGLILDEPILRNISLANLEGISKGSVLSRGREQQVAEKYRKVMNIRTPSVLDRKSVV